MNIHASAVAHGGKGLLIIGASGAGKSSLALAMIALGAQLISDDRTDLAERGGALIARPPAALAGLIEARGIGILRLPYLTDAVIAAVVDLDNRETDRLPPRRRMDILGQQLDLIHGAHYLHFPAALMCYLGGTRAE